MKPSAWSKSKRGRCHLLLAEPEQVLATVVADCPAVEDEAQLEGSGELLLETLEQLIGESLGLEAGGVDVRAARQGAGATAIEDDCFNLLGRVTKTGQGRRHGSVDDLEIAAAGQLLEFDESEVRFDAGGVAIHQQANGPGGSNDRDLGVAIAVLLSQVQHAVALGTGCLEQVVGAIVLVDADRRDGQAFIFLAGRLVSGPAMIADDAQHGLAVGLIARETARPRPRSRLRWRKQAACMRAVSAPH